MEKKTKRCIFLNALTFSAGVAMFAVAINFQIPILGLLGFFAAVYGGLGVIEYLVKGIVEIIEFRKFWEKREHGKSKTNEL